MALDMSGNAYITGITFSADYDITPGALQTTFGGGTYDAFVTKLNATGTALIYSTYIGGSTQDWGSSIALDASGNAYITGFTYSNNYDITPGAFQPTLAGGSDAIVTKLNATGTALIYSTYIGGNTQDWGSSIALDAFGNAYITGTTNSANFDIIPGAFQTTLEGNYDAIVTKLNATGTALIYSTYIGGSSSDIGRAIALDTLNNVYISGMTYSADYDITPGAFQTIQAGDYDVFVSKLSPTGTALIYSTYIGGSGDDQTRSISVKSPNNVFITGYTKSSNFDITPGAFQTILEGTGDVFVSRLGQLFPLPIELIKFEGVAMENENEINWNTASEINFSHYELESAEDGKHFKIIDTIMSLGNTNEIKCYTYKDKNYYSPVTYYRLKSVDIDGSYNYSKIISIKRDENSTGVVVYPNPSQGLYEIEFRNGANNYSQIEVLDMQGNIIEKQNIYNKKSINLDLSKHANGVYILKVTSNNRQEIVRLVKL